MFCLHFNAFWLAVVDYLFDCLSYLFDSFDYLFDGFDYLFDGLSYLFDSFCYLLDGYDVTPTDINHLSHDYAWDITFIPRDNLISTEAKPR